MSMQSGLTLLSAPALEPVSEAEMMAHLRLGSEQEAGLLHGHIRAARHLVESWTGRALISQSWRWFLDAWPEISAEGWWDGVRAGAITHAASRFVEIPKAPLRSIDSVILFDDADQQVVWNASNYFADIAGTPGRLVLRNGAVTPRGGRAASAIQISFTCGFGDAPSDVPAPLRQAVLMLAAHYFENREVLAGTGNGGAAVLPLGVQSLLTPYRMMRL